MSQNTREDQKNRIIEKLIELSDRITRRQDDQAARQADPQTDRAD